MQLNKLFFAPAVVLLLFLLPYAFYGIYPDEVAQQIYTTRFFQDWPLRSSVLPYCYENFKVIIPYFLYPAGVLLSAVSYVSDTRVFRFFTFVIFLIAYWVGYKVLSKRYSEVSNKVWVLIAVILFTGPKMVGVSIYRPEILTILLFFYGIWILQNRPNSLSHKISFLMLYTCSLSNHIMGIYFIPGVLIVCGATYLLSAFSLVATFQAYKLWHKQLIECSFEPLNALNKSFYINPIDFLTEPSVAFDRFRSTFSLRTFQIWIKRLSYNENYSDQIGFLPNFNPDNIFIAVSNIVAAAIFILALVCVIAQLFKFIKRGLVKAILPQKDDLFVSLFLIAVLVHMSLNRTAAFYAVSFWYVILTFATVYFCLPKIIDIYGKGNFFSGILYFIFFSIAVSQVIFAGKLVRHYGPNIPLVKQFYYNSLYRRKVLATYKDYCTKIGGCNSVQIDDASYFVLKRDVHFPIPITYSAMFNDYKSIHKHYKTTVSVARCGSNRHMFGQDNEEIVVDGGFGDHNICIRKITVD